VLELSSPPLAPELAQMPFAGLSDDVPCQCGVGGQREQLTESGHEGFPFGSRNGSGKGAVELVQIPNEGSEGMPAGAEILQINPVKRQAVQIGAVHEEVGEFKVHMRQPMLIDAHDLGAKPMTEPGTLFSRYSSQPSPRMEGIEQVSSTCEAAQALRARESSHRCFHLTGLAE
jgi:hypothetical protein